MDGELIGKCDDSQESALEFVDRSPEPIAILPLRLDTCRRLNDPMHISLEVWPFAYHLFLKVDGEPVIRHTGNVSESAGRR